MPDLFNAEIKPKPKVEIEPMSDLLGSFSLKPANVGFENQNNDETIILLLRRHWITNLGWFLVAILLFFCPVIFIDFPAVAILPLKYKIMCLIGWYLLLIAFIFEKFLSWFFNVGIVTDQRLIDVNFYGLLYKQITDAELDKIEDVTQEQIGAIRTVFDFGDVHVQTAGAKDMIDFVDIPHPEKVVKILQDLR